MQPLEICIGPTIRIGRESWCLPYAGFLFCNKVSYYYIYMHLALANPPIYIDATVALVIQVITVLATLVVLISFQVTFRMINQPNF